MNEDQPASQQTTEEILPQPTVDQMIATAINVGHRGALLLVKHNLSAMSRKQFYEWLNEAIGEQTNAG